MPGSRSNLHQVLAGRKISRTTLGNHGCSSFQAGRAAPSSEPAHNQQEPEETQSSQALGTSQRVHRGRQEANTTIPGWWCSRWEREGSTEFPVVPLFLTWMVGTQESASWQVINLCTYMVPLWYTWVIHHREEMRFKKKKEFRCQLLATRKQWRDSSVFHSPVWKCRTIPHKMIH